MQIRSLQAFVAAAQQGSFIAAAEQLCTVQSNITAHIKKLEDELTIQLFKRQPSLTLTPAGHQLLSYAIRLLQLHEQTRQLFTDATTSSGELRLGSMETTLAMRLPPLLAAFHQQYPQIKLSITSAPTAQLMESLNAGQLDIVFVAGQQPSAIYQQKAVFAEQLVLVSHQPLPALPTAETLSQSTFLAFRQGCSYRQRIELLMAQQGVNASRIIELGSLDAITGCVAAGMGLAVLPRKVAEAQLHQLFFQPLPDNLSQITTWMVAPAESGWTPALRQFFHFVPAAE